MKIFSALKKDLLILLRSRVEMAILFLMPLAFILPISYALGSGDGYGIRQSSSMIPLLVVDYDGGPRAQMLLNTIGESLRLEKEFDYAQIQNLGLADDPDCTALDTLPGEEAQEGAEQVITITITPTCAEKIARGLLDNGDYSAVLVIPLNFSDAIDNGRRTWATLLYDPAGDSTRMMQIEGVVKGATVRLSVDNQVKAGMSQMADLVAFAPEEVRSAFAQGAAPTPDPAAQTTGGANPVQTIEEPQQPAIHLSEVEPGSFQLAQTPDTYQQTIPGYTVMSVFFIILSLSSSIRQERLNGTFRRLMSTPVSRAELLGSKLLATIIIGLVQVLILFAIGALVFKLDLGRDPLAFFLLTLALVSAATAIGLAASTTKMGGASLSAPLIIGALLGGCMFPLDLMPGFLRALSRIVPHSWALTGYQNLMVRGQGINEVLPQIAVLVLFAVVFFVIAIRRFDFETQETGL